MSSPALTDGLAIPSAGWYGKIPALGDFASRRLPQDFIDQWDDWLQRALLASRAHLQERWQESYLSSPIWRFMLSPGVCGEGYWAGVMMPSVDKVGRHFPLTIAAALSGQPEPVRMVVAAHAWFDAIEQIALSCLNLDFPVDELEARLASTPYPADPADKLSACAAAQQLAGWWAGPGGMPLALSLPWPHAMPELLNASGLSVLTGLARGKSLWWTTDDLAGTSELHAFSGLPPEDYFSILLSGTAPPQAAI
jgi:type VI secretion system protein ImpM